MVSQENEGSSGSSAQPFAWCIARFDKISGKLLQRDTVYSPVEAAVMANLTHSFDVVVTELFDHAQPSANAALDVLAERQRQISVEGWTPEHDDQYHNDELAIAASCYALATDAALQAAVPELWPWVEDWWKPTTERRNLVKAGALILAEIERLDRAATVQP